MSKAALNDMYTELGKALDKSAPHQYYPRPQLRRNSFFSLNGQWSFFETEGAQEEQITVPFPPEALLSGIGRRLSPVARPIYKRTFTLPEGFVNERVILNFGAVDQCAEVFVNGASVGGHVGGYEAFSFDITDHLLPENTVEVRVLDDLPSHVLPYGKQRIDRGGMWYTPVTGIWQSVWLESVPSEYIRSMKIFADDKKVDIYFSGADEGIVTLECGRQIRIIDGRASFEINEPHLWSPEDPYLYTFTVRSGNDEISSYFAMRNLSVESIDGKKRLCLNGKPYFFHGVLDQGYFSDGIFTPASEEEYARDIMKMKALGFNTLRKHIKVEPEIFYYYCDKLGMVVFQDMVNNGKYSFIRDTALPTVGLKRLPDRFLHRDEKTREAFRQGMRSTANQLFNHPCICYWTIFNEGWGQFDSESVYKYMKTLDTSRFIDTASGWFEGAESSVTSPHIYFKPVKLRPSEKPTVVSEFGGYVYKDPEHSFNSEKTYGYKIFEDRAEFEKALEALYMNEIVPNIANGLCGAIYTQLSDVEDETNGLITYDRKVTKVTEGTMKNIAEAIFSSLPYGIQ